MTRGAPQPEKTPMSYTYKTVPMAPEISSTSKKKQGEQAAAYLQSIINKHARDDWEFHRVDSFTVSRPAGCLALFGQGDEKTAYYVATFRRAKHSIDEL